MAEGDRNEPINEQVVANMYSAMRNELNQIYSKITELEMDVSEHSLVINAIQPLDPSRRCYRMIGGVLVERTIKEVLPAVLRNKEGIEEVIARLNEAAERKKKEISDFEAKYKIRIRKSDGEVKDDANKKEGSSQGVLVGPAVIARSCLGSYTASAKREENCKLPGELSRNLSAERTCGRRHGDVLKQYSINSKALEADGTHYIFYLGCLGLARSQAMAPTLAVSFNDSSNITDFFPKQRQWSEGSLRNGPRKPPQGKYPTP
ncbi:hypothetical protein OIU84_021473 [Salix udensis]|uniref:Prefoldin subunit 2 n=1 Tax=Salix udensis TaxID=889485 RepID=A0AAD6KUZ0_9ROSI|nr:hypothetical protein OIU84_021473 [Salix udensis]